MTLSPIRTRVMPGDFIRERLACRGHGFDVVVGGVAVEGQMGVQTGRVDDLGGRGRAADVVEDGLLDVVEGDGRAPGCACSPPVECDVVGGPDVIR